MVLLQRKYSISLPGDLDVPNYDRVTLKGTIWARDAKSAVYRHVSRHTGNGVFAARVMLALDDRVEECVTPVPPKPQPEKPGRAYWW